MNQFMDINVSKREREQFMNIHVSKRRSFRPSPFVFHPFIFGRSAAQNGGLSFFNVHSVFTANALKPKDLRKRHFWLQIFESRETAKTQNVRYKIRSIILSLPRRSYTPHAARNWPYILRRETLHHVRFYVGFADLILHTQHRWLSNFKPALCRICRECMNPLKTVWVGKPNTRVCARILLTFSSCAVFVVIMTVI